MPEWAKEKLTKKRIPNSTPELCESHLKRLIVLLKAGDIIGMYFGLMEEL